jgi:multidrug resistance protein, MATE family
MIAQGISEASATLVGNTIGADQAALSKRITWTLYMFTSLLEGCIGFILYYTWSDIIKVYTREEEVVTKAIDVAMIIAVTQFINGLQGFL